MVSRVREMVPNRKRNKTMTALQTLAITNPDECSRGDIHNIFNCESQNLNKVLKDEFESCNDIELLKKIAIAHDGYDYQYSLEDILIEKMGEDEYNEFADENDL